MYIKDTHAKADRFHTQKYIEHGNVYYYHYSLLKNKGWSGSKKFDTTMKECTIIYNWQLWKTATAIFERKKSIIW